MSIYRVCVWCKLLFSVSVSLSLTNVFLLILSLSLPLSRPSLPPRHCFVRLLPPRSFSLFVVRGTGTLLSPFKTALSSSSSTSLFLPLYPFFGRLNAFLSLSFFDSRLFIFFLYLLFFSPPISFPCPSFFSCSRAPGRITKVQRGVCVDQKREKSRQKINCAWNPNNKTNK